MFFEISQNSRENTCLRVSFLAKLQATVCNFNKKEILAQVFFCEFRKILKNTFLTEHIQWLKIISLDLVALIRSKNRVLSF